MKESSDPTRRYPKAADHSQAGLQRTIVGVLMLLMIIRIGGVNAEERTTPYSAAKEVGTEHVQAFDLPVSSLLTNEEKTALQQKKKRSEEFFKTCPSATGYLLKNLPEYRKCIAEKIAPPIIEKLRSRYRVRIQAETIAGVYTDIITPADGVSRENRQRVLINLHGGGFVQGARYGGQMESIPIAAAGQIKVVSVDYRMAPEHKFPAATEDAVAVYRSLLREYKAENIGIYGCSAGGLLTAQTVAWMQKRQLPLPGAVGLFCTGGTFWAEGDSAHFDAALKGISAAPAGKMLDQDPYFKEVDANDPLVFPARSAQVMAQFPPSLLITTTRDIALSSVAYTHSRLIQQGVEADLHVWEGLGHCFYVDPEIPQSSEVYKVIVRFFDSRLGK